MWVDRNASIRPVVGQSYESLYVRVHRTFGLGDSKVWGDSSVQGSFLSIECPGEGEAGDPYQIFLDVDFGSGNIFDEIVAGQTVEVTSITPIEITSSFVFDFYDE